jgi:predicted 3-demethylubiquinone-9 3-methyltransferase (glyoxalase superfamily)
MPKTTLSVSVSLIITILTGCGNTHQNADKQSFSDTTTKAHRVSTQKITPCLWVETRDAKSVADYYLSIFKDGKLKEYHQYKNPIQEGKEITNKFETANIEIAGIEFSILAAGPFVKFNESVSFVINCKDQAEVDYYWKALTTNGGQESSCGWCKDKYGVSWQVVPVEYFDLINSDDPEVREKAIRNTLKQKKLILSELK